MLFCQIMVKSYSLDHKTDIYSPTYNETINIPASTDIL